MRISFSILEILPKKFGAHQKFNLFRLHINAKDIYCKSLIASQLFLLENCLLHSSAKSAIMYSAATFSARKVFH